MKKNFKIIAIVAVLSAALLSFLPKEENDPEKDKILIELLTFIIEKGHFDPKDMDDNFSRSVYSEYITALDPSKRLFLASDIEEFKQFENLVDDQVKNKDLSFFNLTYDRLMQRSKESEAYFKDVLDKPIDYSIDEDFNTDYEKIPYADNKQALKDRWRKQIKLSTLSSLNDKLKYEEDKKNGVFEKPADSLSASEKIQFEKAKKDNEAPKSFEELEKETRESALKSLNEVYGFINDLERKDWFAVYLNAIAEGFDPHTSYMAPEDKEQFDVSMSGKFFGIGARLQKKNDYTEITELISGGPAWRGKELEAGDLVMKVAQGDKEPVDIVGMRIDEVVKKIKGPKDTEVRLTVKKADGSIKIISIIRDEVEIEETYAKSSVVEKNGKKYGVIYLPKFYINFENKDDRDAAKDVALEVERLKKEGVEGIVMDLRDNGGGSLRTVVDIAGLFIEEGPIVQVKTTGKDKEILSDTNPKIQWDGPLVVMINNFSASASEILAAAIQDYKRGVVIGSKQSYGKGTVQVVYGLNDFIRNTSLGDLGALKTTTQKFYRINGGSTQLKGVSSDVAMPDRFSYIEIGERDMKNAMPWDKIDAAKFDTWRIPNYDEVISKSRKRMAQNQQFKMIDENAKWISQRREAYVYSLQLDKFKKEQENLDAEAKKYKPISDYKNSLIFNSLPNEIALMQQDSVFKEKRVRWHQSLAKDIYVEEALNVLSDMQETPPTKATLPASKAKKGKLVGSL